LKALALFALRELMWILIVSPVCALIAALVVFATMQLRYWGSVDSYLLYTDSLAYGLPTGLFFGIISSTLFFKVTILHRLLILFSLTLACGVIGALLGIGYPGALIGTALGFCLSCVVTWNCGELRTRAVGE